MMPLRARSSAHGLRTEDSHPAMGLTPNITTLLRRIARMPCTALSKRGIKSHSARDSAAPECQFHQFVWTATERVEPVSPIICAVPAPLQSVLSRIGPVDVRSGEGELRLLLAFVLLGAVTAAATVLVTRSAPGRVG